MKKLSCFILIFVMLFSMTAFASADSERIAYNGVVLTSHEGLYDVDDYPYCLLYEDDGDYVFSYSKVPFTMGANSISAINYGEPNSKSTSFDIIYDASGNILSTRTKNRQYATVSPTKYLWSNVDISLSDGTVHFTATEPYDPDTYPPLPEVNGAYKHYVISQASSGRYDYSVFVSDKMFTVSGKVGDAYIATFSEPVDVVRYSSTNNQPWVLDTSGEDWTQHSVGANGYLTLVASSFNWYDEDTGEMVFPHPLWETVGTVTQGTMPELNRNLGGTMRTLALCGAGSMALLVALKLLGKRSLIFRR